VYRRKRIGPRTDPCGTPYNSVDDDELDLDVRTLWIRPLR
jgi:hypothetical protein